MKNAIFKLRVFLWAVLVLVVFWLLYMGVVPSGRISYVRDFKKENYFIERLTPKERVKLPAGGVQKIIGSPVYFYLETPRRFAKAELIFKYKNSDNLPLIEAGVLVDKKSWRYNLKPIENKALNQLADIWSVLKEGSVILFQREKKYNSIDEFTNNPPQRSEIALYNANLKKDFILPGYEPQNKEQKIGFSLRGSWQAYVYIKNEELNFSFDTVDLNKNKDSDWADFNLYFNSSLMESRYLNDDGIVDDSGKKSERGKMEFKIADLPEGVYKIELRASDDIIAKNIITKQKNVSFINKIWLAEGSGENIILYSDSDIISAQTTNPGRLQAIRVGESDLKISETYRQFSIKASGTAPEIKPEKDDIILAGNGMFSPDKDGLFNPEFKKVDENFNADEKGVNYILADYASPFEENGWKIGRVVLNLNGAFREDERGLFNRNAGKYNFIISIPGLKVEDNTDDGVEIKEIRINLEGANLWEKVKKIYNSPPY